MKKNMKPLLEVNNLCKKYKRSQSFLTTGLRQTIGPINLTLEKGQTLSIVGESGSGKSSLVKIIAGLIPATSGEIFLNGKRLISLSKQQRCKAIRMVFQEPQSSLNPKATIERILSAPLELNTKLNALERAQRIKETLVFVKLLPDYLAFYPRMLTSVQQHKVAIARALILNPDIIIADEILATIDNSLRFKIVNLLLNIQEKKGISYIFVAHNLNLVRHMSDQIMVMKNGLVVEYNETEDIYNNPQSETTKHLLLSGQTDYRK
jgi:cationic peptide transport system ATP-binding protein